MCTGYPRLATTCPSVKYKKNIKCRRDISNIRNSITIFSSDIRFIYILLMDRFISTCIVNIGLLIYMYYHMPWGSKIFHACLGTLEPHDSNSLLSK